MTIFGYGDSTAATCAPEFAPITGWGQGLEEYIPGAAVVTKVMGGRSTKSFLADGRLTDSEARMQPGDRGVWHNMRMIAHQDTLFCGPTMPKVARDALPRTFPEGVISVGGLPAGAEPPVLRGLLHSGRRGLHLRQCPRGVDMLLRFQGDCLTVRSRKSSDPATNTFEGIASGYLKK